MNKNYLYTKYIDTFQYLDDLQFNEIYETTKMLIPFKKETQLKDLYTIANKHIEKFIYKYYPNNDFEEIYILMCHITNKIIKEENI